MRCATPSCPSSRSPGWLTGAFIGGAVVIESVFSRQGLGQLAVASINARDFPTVAGIVVISASAFVVLNLIVDSLYPRLDPRLREAPAGAGSKAQVIDEVAP